MSQILTAADKVPKRVTPEKHIPRTTGIISSDKPAQQSKTGKEILSVKGRSLSITSDVLKSNFSESSDTTSDLDE